VHGQTVFHDAPTGKKPNMTLQIGSADVLAQGIGATVVSDFRSADVVAGGRGAPLTPIAHYRLLGSRSRNRVVLNLGGISNITYLPAGCGWDGVRGTDCGPGNMLIDRIVQRLVGERFDRNGRMASLGCLNDGLMRTLKRSPFLKRRLPIAIGREQFGEQLVDELVSEAARNFIPGDDVVATLSHFTVYCVSRAVAKYGHPDELIVCGGGARNRYLMNLLRSQFKGTDVKETSKVGIDPDFVESISFALLANLSVDYTPINLSNITGSSGAVNLGKVTRP